jgi:DNA repair exonuclease SbcCD ATPase subunit
MPRVTTVQRAKKSPGSCSKCQKAIKTSDSYRWWKPRYGRKHVRCVQPACAPRASDLTSSDKLSRVYGAGESIEDAIEQFRKDKEIEALKGVLEDAAQELNEVAEEYRESASNIESGFNGNRMPMCDELEEKADNLESKAEEIESAAGDLEDFDEDGAKEEAEAEAESELDEFAEGEREEKLEELVEKKVKEKKDEWVEDQASKVEEFTDLDPDG